MTNQLHILPFKYKGCLVSKVNGGYLILGEIVKDKKGVDDVIKKAYTALGKSIITQSTK